MQKTNAAHGVHLIWGTDEYTIGLMRNIDSRISKLLILIPLRVNGSNGADAFRIELCLEVDLQRAAAKEVALSKIGYSILYSTAMSSVRLVAKQAVLGLRQWFAVQTLHTVCGCQ